MEDTKKEETRLLEKRADFIKAIAHPVRLAILKILVIDGSKNNDELCKTLEMQQSLISYHLNGMKNYGIIKTERQGKRIYYHIKAKGIAEFLQAIDSLEFQF